MLDVLARLMVWGEGSPPPLRAGLVQVQGERLDANCGRVGVGFKSWYQRELDHKPLRLVSRPVTVHETTRSPSSIRQSGVLFISG